MQTVNDVLVGVTYAALSRYYFRKSGDILGPGSYMNTSILQIAALLTVALLSPSFVR